VRTLCKVRAAGTAGSPTAYIATATTVTSLSPSPFANPGPAFLGVNGTVSATYDNNVSGASASSFVVNGAESGRAFLSGASFSGSGTKTVTSPAGNYF